VAAHDVVSCLAISPIPDRWSFDGAGGYGAVSVRPRLIVNTTDAAADAAAQGLGLTVLVCYQADAHVLAGRLVRVLETFEPPRIPIQIVQPSGRFVTPKIRLFIDHLAADLRARYG
jgi:DNA-binding transcriptional LysR family regulator